MILPNKVTWAVIIIYAYLLLGYCIINDSTKKIIPLFVLFELKWWRQNQVSIKASFKHNIKKKKNDNLAGLIKIIKKVDLVVDNGPYHQIDNSTHPFSDPPIFMSIFIKVYTFHEPSCPIFMSNFQFSCPFSSQNPKHKRLWCICVHTFHEPSCATSKNQLALFIKRRKKGCKCKNIYIYLIKLCDVLKHNLLIRLFVL